MLRAMDRPLTISRTIEICLRSLGIWPGMAYQHLPRFIWSASLILFQTFQYHYLVAYYNTESIYHLVDNLSITLPYTNTLFKLSVLCFNESVFRDVLAAMNRGCRIRANVASNNLISKTAGLSHRLSTALIVMYPITVILYAMGVMLSKEQFGGQDGQPRKLFFLMKLPFDINQSLVFITALAVQFIHQMAAATAAGLITGLLVTLILHVGCQVDILCQRFKEISSDNTKQLGHLIEMHQDVIRLMENIAKLFTHIALVQLLSSTLSICCIGFLIVISIGTENASDTLVKCALFYVAVVMESFVFCFAGEYLNTKSSMVSDAAYESLWYDLRPKESRVLLFIILRSQKALTITIGRISNLSLNSFASILKASASYISVLLAF